MHGDYDASIIAKFPTGEQMSRHVKNVGSMDNAKKHARKFTKSLKLKPVSRNWKTESTNFAEDSGLHGSWESRATRQYIGSLGERVEVTILRA